MTPRPRNPLESFGPEILAAFVKASRETVTITTTYRKGVAFQQRLNQFRTQLQRLGHELYPIAARVKVSLAWGTKAGLPSVEQTFNTKKVPRPLDIEVTAILTLAPHDSEFSDALRIAGVEAHPLTDDPLSGRSVDDILATYEPTESKQ